MCRGSGEPGSRTTSSGNKGRRAKESPIRAVTTQPVSTTARRTSRLYDRNAGHTLGPHLDLPPRGEYNASMELVGQVVGVTGASLGIGGPTAKNLAEKGPAWGL